MRKKALLIFLIILMSAVLTLGLFACDRSGKEKNEKAGKERAAAVTDFENALMAGLDVDWRADYSDDRVAVLNDAGNYVSTLEWTKFAGKLLSASALPTAKITSVSAALKSEAGVKLLRNENPDGGELLDLFKNVGFTSVDICELLYGGVEAVLNDYKEVFSACYARFDSLKRNPTLTAEANSSVTAAMISMSEAEKSFAEFAADKEEITKAIGAARGGIDALISFAYDISVSPFTGDIFEAVSSGALQNITDGELKTYINSVLSGVGSLKAALNAAQIDKMNAAFELLLKKFDDLNFYSKTFDNLVAAIGDYLNYAYTSLDFIPTALKLIFEGGKSVDDKFIEVFRAYAQKDVPKENRVIFASEFLLSALDGVNKKRAMEVVEGIAKNAAKDFNKASALFDFDAWIRFFFADVSFSMTEDEWLKVIEFSTRNRDLKAFKTAYADYVAAGRDLVSNELRMKTESLIGYIGEEPLVMRYTDRWYEEMIRLTDLKNKSVVSEYKDVVIKDIREMVGAIFDKFLPLAREAVGMELVLTEDDPRYERLFEFDYYLLMPLIFDGQMPK